MAINPTHTSIILYDDRLELQLDQEHETIWATQADIVELFDIDQSVVARHIRNIFTTGEVDEKSNMQKMHIANSDKPVNIYSLDIVLAVWYRTSSGRATKFRKWATKRLKEYLIQGYSINQKRLQELQKTIELITIQKDTTDISLTEAKWLLDIISQYSESFTLLSQFDSDTLGTTGDEYITYIISYDAAKVAIQELRETLMKQWEATELFGNEKDTQFTGILSSIIATFDGIYLYPTIEDQAAHLLYFIIKDHPFSDGNKRIGALLFMWFLEQNKHRFRKDGLPKINESGLVALALLIAASPPSEKTILIRLVINLIKNS